MNVVVFLAELFLLLEASTADRAEDGLHGDGESRTDGHIQRLEEIRVSATSPVAVSFLGAKHGWHEVWVNSVYWWLIGFRTLVCCLLRRQTLGIRFA